MKHEYKIVKTLKEVNELIGYCKKTGYCAFDFETTSLRYYDRNDSILCLGISFQPGSGWVIPLDHKEGNFKNNWLEIFKHFGKEVLEDIDIIKIGWNLKFEIKWCMRYGIHPQGRLFDGMLAKYLLKEERPSGLKEVTAMVFPQYAGFDAEMDKLTKKHGWTENIPLDKLAYYNSMDSDLTLRLMLYFEPKLINLGFYQLFRNLLMRGSSVLAKCESRGFNINVEELRKTKILYEILIRKSERKLRKDKKFLRYCDKKLLEKKKKLISSVRKEIKDLYKELKEHRKNNKIVDERFISGIHRKISGREDKVSRYMTNTFKTKDELKVIEPFNFGSTQQLVDLFYISDYGFKFDIIKNKDSGNPTTNEEAIIELQRQYSNKFLQKLLDHRGITHIYDNFIIGLMEKVDDNNLIHTNFNLHKTVTGRLCIGGETKLLLNKGVFPIKYLCPRKEGIRIVKGQEILTHTGEWRKILYGINKGKEEMFEVELENGKKITCTKNHKFLTPQGWNSLEFILYHNLKILYYEGD